MPSKSPSRKPNFDDSNNPEKKIVHAPEKQWPTKIDPPDEKPHDPKKDLPPHG